MPCPVRVSVEAVISPAKAPDAARSNSDDIAKILNRMMLTPLGSKHQREPTRGSSVTALKAPLIAHPRLKLFRARKMGFRRFRKIQPRNRYATLFKPCASFDL